MFSDRIDDEDMAFMAHDFITYTMACEYYGLGLKPVTRMSHAAGAVYKIGKKVLIRRSIFEAYLRERQRLPLTALRAPEAEKQEAIDGLYSQDVF